MKQQNVISPRNILYEFLVILNGLVLIGIWWLILRSGREAAFAGCVSYLVIAWCLRLTLQKHHRHGMQLLRSKNYADAADAFQKSRAFFEKYPWIDKYRFITMFSSNAIPYEQMALNNMGLCYLHLGENGKALDAFQTLARQNPKYPRITEVIAQIQNHINESNGAV